MPSMTPATSRPGHEDRMARRHFGHRRADALRHRLQHLPIEGPVFRGDPGPIRLRAFWSRASSIIFLKGHARDITDVDKLQGEVLIALPACATPRTFFVKREVKENERLPF